MYAYIDNHGFLVQKYGQHVFHTPKKNIYDFICKYEIWNSYKLTCGAIWNNKYTPVSYAQVKCIINKQVKEAQES